MGASSLCQARTGRVSHFDIFVDHLTVEDHFDEPSVPSFLARGIEARRLEDYVQGLPLSGRERCVRARRSAVVDMMIFGFSSARG